MLLVLTPPNVWCAAGFVMGGYTVDKRVALVRCAGYVVEQVQYLVRRAVDLLGGMERVVKPEVSLGLARQGLKVLGVDRSPAMLAVGAERLAAAADYLVRSLGLAQGNAYNVPAGDLAFFGSHDLELFGRWSSDLLVLATRQGTS